MATATTGNTPIVRENKVQILPHKYEQILRQIHFFPFSYTTEK